MCASIASVLRFIQYSANCNMKYILDKEQVRYYKIQFTHMIGSECA